MVNTETSEPAQPDRKTSTDVATVGKMTLRVSSLNAGQIIQDNSTGAVYLNVIAASMGWMVIGSTEPKKKTHHRMDICHPHIPDICHWANTNICIHVCSQCLHFYLQKLLNILVFTHLYRVYTQGNREEVDYTH